MPRGRNQSTFLIFFSVSFSKCVKIRRLPQNIFAQSSSFLLPSLFVYFLPNPDYYPPLSNNLPQFFHSATIPKMDSPHLIPGLSPSPLPLNHSPSCEDMNSFLWADRRDLTTRSSVMAIFAALYSTIILLGLLGNACVIVAIARIRSLQTVPNMFIFSLSCSDMLVCCISATITPITAFRKDWIFGQFLCSFAPFIAGVSLCFSTFTLAAISVDRFLLILFPTRKAFSHGQAMIIILVICLLASGFSLPMLFMQKLKPVANYCGQFCFEDWGQNHGTRRIYGTLMLTVQFIIPLALITFCYTAISVRLGKSVNLRAKKKECEWQMPVSAQRNAATKRRQRTNRMFIAMTLAFSLSWGWSVLYNLLRDYDGLPRLVLHQEFFFGILTHCIAMSSTVWNPILYALLNLQLRAAFIQLIPQCLKDQMGRIFGQKTKEGGIGQQNSVEENRLLGTSNQNGGGNNRRQGSVEGKKWLTCFLNSSGSVESSTSDPRPNLLLVREGDGRQKAAEMAQNGTERRGKTQRNERYGSCLTELEEQTWNGPIGTAAEIGEKEIGEEEGEGEMDENV